MIPFILACATARPEWIRSLRAVAQAEGWRLLLASSPWRLLSMLETGHRGLVVADWEPLDASSGLARRWVARARQAAPGCAVVFSAEQSCFGASLSRLLAAGVDDAVERSLSPIRLADKLRLQAKRHGAAGLFLEAPGGQLRLDQRLAKLFIKRRGRWEEADTLSPKETALLRGFLEKPGVVLERCALLSLLRPGREHDINLETVDKHVESLRRKLGRHGELITTVYGAGYKFG